MENNNIITCRTEFDTAGNTMTLTMANGFKAVCDFNGEGSVVLSKDSEVKNSFSMEGKKATDLFRYLMDTAEAAAHAS